MSESTISLHATLRYTDRKNHLGERDGVFERKLFAAFETNNHSLTVKEYSLTVNTRRQIT